jgi:hypothetical protein
MRNQTTIDTRMPDGTAYPVRTLLTDGTRNVKLAKSDAAGLKYETVGLTLSPTNLSGYNVCAFASPACRSECLVFTGHNTFTAVRRAQIAKTRAFFQDRDAFKIKLFTEIDRAQMLAKKHGNRLACRLNILSDIPWERVWPELFSAFPRVAYYDYTKRPDRVVPANYHLTFSRSETNETVALAEYARGLNIAVVFESADLPAFWNGIPVFSGDKTDLRFLDPRGIVGLYAKGSRAKNDQSGFVVRPQA